MYMHVHIYVHTHLLQGEELLSACYAESTADVSALLEKRADVHFIGKVKTVNALYIHCNYALVMAQYCFCPQNGFTALHMAAQKGKVDVVILLTEAKAHVNVQTEVHTL